MKHIASPMLVGTWGLAQTARLGCFLGSILERGRMEGWGFVLLMFVHDCGWEVEDGRRT
jgi:hypothetical protein